MPRVREDDQREDQAEQQRPAEHREDLDAAVGGEAEPAPRRPRPKEEDRPAGSSPPAVVGGDHAPHVHRATDRDGDRGLGQRCGPPRPRTVNRSSNG